MSVASIRTEIIRAIDKVLTDKKIPHYIDDKVKSWDGIDYIGIKKSPRRLFFLHYFRDRLIEAIVPLSLDPEAIKLQYGIKGKQKFYDTPSQHYILMIPIAKSLNDHELINGKFSIEEKSDFFCDIARLR